MVGMFVLFSDKGVIPTSLKVVLPSPGPDMSKIPKDRNPLSYLQEGVQSNKQTNMKNSSGLDTHTLTGQKH